MIVTLLMLIHLNQVLTCSLYMSVNVFEGLPVKLSLGLRTSSSLWVCLLMMTDQGDALGVGSLGSLKTS
jgi:hypothetical protein